MNKKLKRLRRAQRVAVCALLVVFLAATLVTPALAADVDIPGMDLLYGLVFGFLRAMGVIVAAYGILSLVIGWNSQDTMQRITGFGMVAGGIILSTARLLLTQIGLLS